MKASKTSIIIPHFNRPDSLRVLLKSIFEEETLLAYVDGQKGAKALADLVQVIVIDDNSTEQVDLYNQVKAEFEKAYPGAILFLRNTTGVNASGTCRNFGLEAADGQWLLFADSDDYFEPGWYEAASDYFDKDFDIIYFYNRGIDLRTGKPTTRGSIELNGLRGFGQPGGWDESELRHRHLPPWSKLIKKCIVDAHGINFPPFLWQDDAVFSLKVAYYAKKVTIDSRVLYNVVDDPSNITKNYSYKTKVARFSCAAIIDKFFRTVERLEPEEMARYSAFDTWTKKFSEVELGINIFEIGKIAGPEWYRYLLSPYGRSTVREYSACTKKIKAAIAKGSPIYIYGAGYVTKSYLPLWLEYRDKRGRGLKVEAIVVSSTEGNPDQIEGFPVVGLDEATPTMKEGFVIVATWHYHEQIAASLKEKGVVNFVCLGKERGLIQ